MTTPAVQFRHITKAFPGVVALDDVSFDVQPGTCHAVCGENGAGKSTLGRILAGLHTADSGELLLDGRQVHFATPRDALKAGVAMVHQELAFCENLTVGDNLCLGELPRRGIFVDHAAVRARAERLLAAIGAGIDPDQPMSSLGVAGQQLVQIATAVGAGARVIVFDEPTSSLGDDEASRLYALIGELKTRGVTMLYVSHRTPEIYRLCDAITVLRDGKHVATRPASELPEADLVRMMIGRSLQQYYPDHSVMAKPDVLLQVESLSSGRRFHDVSFSLHAGEVLGLAGLVGAGRSEIANAIFGLDREATGTIYVRGKRVDMKSGSDAVAQRIGFVPEDRKKQGLVLSMINRENATLPTLDRLSRVGWVDMGTEQSLCRSWFDRLGVRGADDAMTGSLSGGNQQKIVIAKWLAAECDVLILDEPTRGVDVGAKAEIHALIQRLAANGTAILLISSELPELMNLSSRILVLREGRLEGELSRAEATEERLLRLMAGIADAGVSHVNLHGESLN